MRRRLLIIDNDRRTYEALSRPLGLKGWEVALAGNFQRALEALKDSPPTAILLDLDMRNMNPLHMIHDIKEDKFLGHMTILTTSRHPQGARLLEAHAQGAEGFVSKPCSPEAVESLLTGGLGRPGGFRLKEFVRRATKWQPVCKAG